MFRVALVLLTVTVSSGCAKASLADDPEIRKFPKAEVTKVLEFTKDAPKNEQRTAALDMLRFRSDCTHLTTAIATLKATGKAPPLTKESFQSSGMKEIYDSFLRKWFAEGSLTDLEKNAKMNCSE